MSYTEIPPVNIEAELGDIVDISVEKPPGIIEKCELINYQYVNLELKKTSYILYDNFSRITSDKHIELTTSFQSCSFSFKPLMEYFYGRWNIKTKYLCYKNTPCAYGEQTQNYYISKKHMVQGYCGYDYFKETGSVKINDETKLVKIGSTITIAPRINYKLEHCRVKCSLHHYESNKTYDNDLAINKVFFTLGDKFNRLCEFTFIEFKKEHIGKWKIESYLSDKKMQEKKTMIKQVDNIYLFEEKIKIFEHKINPGYIGQYLVMHMNNLDDKLRNCTAFDEISKNTYSINLLTNDSKDIQRYGNCGIRIRIKKIKFEEWYIEEFLNNVNRKYYFFQRLTDELDYKLSKEIYNNNTKKELISKKYKFIKKGSTFMFDLGLCKKSIFCELERPNGTIISLTKDNFNYKINDASFSDDGVWIARYQVDDEIILIEEKYIVSIWDFNHTKIFIKASEKFTNIILNTLEKPKTCVLELPNGTIITSKPKLSNAYRYDMLDDNDKEGNERFDKSIEHSFGICSFRINWNSQHLAEQFGKWKYTMKFYKFNDNDIIPIDCSYPAKLYFCYIQNPVNEVTSMTDKNALYNGTCQLIIKNAEKTDDGIWSCKIGIEEDIKSKIIVSNFLISIRDVFLTGQIMTNKNAANKTDKYLFQCDLKISIDLLEASVIWWWTRPDGYNIFLNDIRYFVNYDVRSSTLSFSEIHEEDIGTWTCHAQLIGKSQSNLTYTLNFEPDVPDNTIYRNYIVEKEILYPVATDKDKDLTINCHVKHKSYNFPSISTCYWFRSDGTKITGISNMPGAEYWVGIITKTICRIKIRDWKDYINQGTWSCCMDIEYSKQNLTCGMVDDPTTNSNGIYIFFGIISFVIIVLVGILIWERKITAEYDSSRHSAYKRS
ncbi:hypothetical protein HCN44_005045 [Aphidius gifuensis]|uniref:Uncharacterized protein n=1 Tax=Aphidius gifuensis TaxID=684658 RepID=A0A834XXN7_APHGI|nr:hypothetical protein HCN44_005045 [Aphidius gifuensis]